MHPVPPNAMMSDLGPAPCARSPAGCIHRTFDYGEAVAMRVVQLALDEMYQELDHAHDGVYALEFGYRGRCTCGWVGPERATKPLARGAVSSHLARTVPGARVVALLRKP